MKQSKTRITAAVQAAAVGGGGALTFADALKAKFPDPTPTPWVRPSGWVALPSLVPTDEKFVGLVAVFPGFESYAGFTSGNDCLVDWGDGHTEVVAANVVARHNYSYADIQARAADAALGHRQAIVTVTPTGQFASFANFRLSSNYSSGQTPPTYWLDIAFASQTAGSFDGNNMVHPWLQQISLKLPSLSLGNLRLGQFSQLRKIKDLQYGFLNTAASLFSGCYFLEELPDLDVTGITDLSFMFNECRRLIKVPNLIGFGRTSGGGYLTDMNCSAMFQNCWSLQFIPALDTRGVAYMSAMFTSCYSLKAVPKLRTDSLYDCNYMFQACQSLLDIPDFDAAPNVYNTYGMFSSCYALSRPPAMPGWKPSQASSMFQNCWALRQMPQGLDLSRVQNLSQFFSECRNLESVPDLDLSMAYSLSSMFTGCAKLTKVGKLTTSAQLQNIGSMFMMCQSLLYGPEITVTSGLTEMSFLFYNCNQLHSFPAYQMAPGCNVQYLLPITTSLREIPAMDFTDSSGSGNLTFGGPWGALARIRCTGWHENLNLSGTMLSATALNEFFTNLPVITTGKTITISSSLAVYGVGGGQQDYATLDYSIATAKGWTIA